MLHFEDFNAYRVFREPMEKRLMNKIFSNETLPKTYRELCAVFLPRTIHDIIDLRNAREVIDLLVGRSLNKDQDDYLETISELIEVYENDHYSIEEPNGLSSLKFLLSENKLNGADLASILKISKSLAYKILDKKRSITPKQMKDLGKYFLVHPGIFL